MQLFVFITDATRLIILYSYAIRLIIFLTRNTRIFRNSCIPFDTTEGALWPHGSHGKSNSYFIYVCYSDMMLLTVKHPLGADDEIVEVVK